MSSSIETRLFINNEASEAAVPDSQAYQFVESKTEKTYKLYNPATDEFVADVHQAGAQDVDAAVAAAEAAFPAWRDTPVHVKAGLFNKLSTLISQSKEELWNLERMAMGRTFGFAHFEVMGCAGLMAQHAGIALHVQGKSSLNTPGMITFTLKQPYGVVAGILPWNVSLIMFAMKTAPALATGNCVIIKSSEKSPLGVLKVAALFKEAGFPPGVLNIVTGTGPTTGSLIASHMKIRKIAFTGSIATGKKVMAAAAASNLKNVTLELGGKSPAIIFGDADIQKAALAVQMSIHLNSGQHCQANSRVFVHESIANEFTEALVKLMTSRSIGDPSDKSVFQGPQGDKIQKERIVSILEQGKKDGTVLCGGKAADVNGKGHFIEPTIIKDVGDASILATEEIFGPVVILNTFKTDEEALERANNTEYGLYSSIYTKDVERALKFATFLEAGAVGLNCSAPTQGMDMPVSGWKQSGIGSEMHMYGVENYLQTKAVYMKYEDVPFH
ncbi:retinal dehydrogenase 2 [Phialemonium atrogriseum]|uniref:aldehyde dehydrogenase (NAD(+)) n=1 Tax=Phialemonium atrogriseum TaxID=1093897 RepID=A0AAJ0FDT3_9PEZI|nr:retinal dehydrogenase 2 [Phialemonium atrogriseum]KAK1764906.1 retinal dehydrogenase 2 [Phialemonium atrogriseum]